MFAASVRSALRARVSMIPRINNYNAIRSSNLLKSSIPQIRAYSSDHHEETFEEFTARYVDLNAIQFLPIGQDI